MRGLLRITSIPIIFIFLLSSFSLEDNYGDLLQGEIISSHSRIYDEGYVAIKINLKPKWHIYSINKNQPNTPTSIKWKKNRNIQLELINVISKDRKNKSKKSAPYYKGEVLFIYKLKVPSSYSESKIALKAIINFTLCNDVCIPGRKTLNARNRAKKKRKNYSK